MRRNAAERAASFHPESVTFRRDNATEPWLVDWDGDGDLDLLIGSMEGEIVLVRNEGSRTEPAYASAAELVYHGTGETRRPIRVHGGEAGPECVDWDDDGDLDLVVGDHQSTARLTAAAQRDRFLELRGRLREVRRQLHALEQARGDGMWRAGYRGPTAYSDSFARMEPLVEREAELVGELEKLSSASTPRGLVWVYLRR